MASIPEPVPQDNRLAPHLIKSPLESARAFGACARLLLQGAPLNGITPEALNGYGDFYETLLAAHREGGVLLVREAWRGLLERHPALIPFICGDDSEVTASVWVPPQGWPMLE